jgi:hypothetical protein
MREPRRPTEPAVVLVELTLASDAPGSRLLHHDRHPGHRGRDRRIPADHRKREARAARGCVWAWTLFLREANPRYYRGRNEARSGWKQNPRGYSLEWPGSPSSQSLAVVPRDRVIAASRMSLPRSEDSLSGGATRMMGY